MNMNILKQKSSMSMSILRGRSLMNISILLKKNLIEIYKTNAISNFQLLQTSFYKYRSKLITYLRDYMFKVRVNIIICKYILFYNRKYYCKYIDYSLYYDSELVQNYLFILLCIQIFIFFFHFSNFIKVYKVN